MTWPLCGPPHNSQVITGDNAARRAEDIGGQELSYAEVKAIASGNPAVLTLAEADAELQRLTLLKKNHLDEQFVARRRVRDLPSYITDLNERLTQLTSDEATATAHATDRITIGKRSWPPADAPGILAGQLSCLPKNVREMTRVPLGTYRGLRFGMVLHPQFPPDVYLEGATTRRDTLLRDHHGARAILNALDRLAAAYGSECVRVRQDLAISESQLRDYQASLGKPFLHDTYLSELTSLRDQLKAGLSETAQADETKPATSELAEKIKMLKAANSIEATPQRERPRQEIWILPRGIPFLAQRDSPRRKAGGEESLLERSRHRCRQHGGISRACPFLGWLTTGGRPIKGMTRLLESPRSWPR